MKFNIKNNDFTGFLREYKTFLLGSGHNVNSIKTYISFLAEFLYWIELKGIDNLKKVNKDVMVSHYDYLVTRKKFRGEGTLSQSSIDAHLFAIRLFNDYLLDTSKLDTAVLLPKFVKSEKKEKEILTNAEILELYKTTTDTFERAVLTIYYGAGLRRTEGHRLNSTDVKFQEKLIVVRDGKGNKSREVVMSDSVIQLLKEYVQEDRVKRLEKKQKYEPAFLINTKGRRASGDTLNLTVRKIVERTQNKEMEKKEVTLHSLRHSFATHLVDNGCDVTFVQRILGHTFIDTSHLYIKRRKNKQRFKI